MEWVGSWWGVRLFGCLSLAGSLAYIYVYVTRHALRRLWERRARGYRRFDGRVVADIISNVISSGYIVEWKGTLRISTSSYTLGCTLQGDTLVVKTVMKTSELGERYGRALRYARRSSLKPVVVNVRQLERWCRMLSQRGWCEVCGITREVEELAYCKLHGLTVCGYCCPTLGGPYLASCRACEHGRSYWKTPKAYGKQSQLAELMRV